MAKVIICDICERPIRDRQYKIKIKKEIYIDVCEECADRIIYRCKKEIEE